MISAVNNTSNVTTNASFSSLPNINLIFAQLQMELAKTSKDEAMSKIQTIKENQEKSKEVSNAINMLRAVKDKVGDGSFTVQVPDEPEKLADLALTKSGISSEQHIKQYLDAVAILRKYNVEATSGTVKKENLDYMISSMETVNEQLSSGTQQDMVIIQDLLGRYNSYTQGASSAVSKATDTLTVAATGR